MRRLLTIVFISVLSCNNFQETNRTNKTNSSDSNLPDNKIDYKQHTYKLFLGQTKDSLKSIIEIQRNFEADRDISADSIQHYMNIGENLIKIINSDTTEVLPAMYFTIRKGILTDFECSIIYEPREKKEQDIYNFLTSLEPYFNKLTPNKNKKELSHKFFLQFNNSTREEKFYIDTTGQYDLLFVYKTQTK